MLERLQAFLKGKSGLPVGILLVLAGVAAVYLSSRSYLGDDLARGSSSRTFICSETGKPFGHELTLGESYPVHSPYSGKNTGWPAEPCYWTKDGKAKKTPTWVLLNAMVNKPGPTFCPDCGRLVEGNNPLPVPGQKPPPTKAEYSAARAER